MKFKTKKIISLLLSAAMLFSLCACASTPNQENADIESPETNTTETEPMESSEVNTEETESTETPEPTPELSEITLAEMEIFDAIDYSQDNFITEAEFYDILQQVLALHDLELTRYPGEGAYYYFNYSNVDNVRLLTMAKTMDEIKQDQEQAQEELREKAEEYKKQQDAIANGEEYVAPETEETQEESEEAALFDSTKDVLNSDDYVTSFVLSATGSEMDQQLMFLLSATVWCIMNPRYNNTDDAFAYLWRALYVTYAHSEGLSASTIDGIDSSFSFTIPGNGVEAWLGTDDNDNFILAITPYAVYDELIDIAGTSGTAFQSTTSNSSLAGLVG